MLGEFQSAIECYTAASDIAKRIGDSNWESRLYCNLGMAYETIGQYQKAVEYCNASLYIARRNRDIGTEGAAFVNLGQAQQHLGLFIDAYNNYKVAIESHELVWLQKTTKSHSLVSVLKCMI
jgi:tetratricopeptide (TPR) repeat protein